MRIGECVVLVSGGASGLGEATCRHFIERGVRKVVILDRDAPRGTALAAGLGERAYFAEADITDCVAVDEAVRRAVQSVGGIHAIVNAAGIPHPARLLGRDGPIAMEKFDRVIKVNLYGAFHVIRAVACEMVKNEPNTEGERGVIINVASGAAFEGQVGQIAYSASKAALVGMTFPLMRELAQYGIRVVTIAPGAFDTPIYDNIPPAVKEMLGSQSLFPRRMGRPEEFARFAAEIIDNPMHNGRTYRFDAGVILAATPN